MIKNGDKLNHIIAFVVLYIILEIGYKKDFIINSSSLLAIAVSIEIVQYFIPTREFSIWDIFADGIGIILGYFICIIQKKTKKSFCKLK